MKAKLKSGLFCFAALISVFANAADNSASQPSGGGLTDAEFASLKSHLANAEASVRQTAISELGETSDPRAIKLLLTVALSSANGPIKSLGIKTANTHSYFWFQGRQDNATEEGLEALKVLAKHPAKDQIVPSLTAFLASQVSTRLAAVRNADATDFPFKAMNRDDYAVDIVNLLGECRDERAVDSLAAVLRSTYVPRVQAARVRKIPNFVMPATTQRAAAKALAKIGGKKAADALVGILVNPPSSLAAFDKVSEALAGSNNANAIKPLVTAIGGMRNVPKPPQDEDFLKRRGAIAAALKGLTGQDLGEDTEAWTAWLKNNPSNESGGAATAPSTPQTKTTASEMEQRLIKQRRFTYKFAADPSRPMELLPDGKFGVGPGGGKVGGSPDSFEQSWKATEEGIVISGSHGDYTLRMGADGIMRGRISDLGFNVTLSPEKR